MCGLVVCITVFNAMGCVPMYLLIPGVGARQGVSFLNILCFTDVGFGAQRGRRRRDFCREAARLVGSAVTAQLKEDSLQPTRTCEEGGRLFRGQSGQVVVKTACLLRLKAGLIISR